MTKVILVGSDVALLEGLAQTLLGFGHDVLCSATIADAALSGDPPSVAIVSSEALESFALGATLPLAQGSALIVYGKLHAERPFLPPKLQRAILAQLVLPLERQRLVALVQSFESRSRTTGRSNQAEGVGGDYQLDL